MPDENEDSVDRSRIGGPSTGSRPVFRRGHKPPLEPARGLAPGKRVGDFRLVGLVGQGGMGQIWEAEQLSLGRRRVAVKFVLPERVTERQLELFAREARAGGRLQHPGLVTIFAHGTSDGLAWIAMEFVEGAWTLKDFLDEAARAEELPPDYDRSVAVLVAAIADAMQAAHEVGVIHRDLKPHNVLITPDDRPKVTDFGLARITDEAALSMTGELAGTYAYMSPEQVTARRIPVDHRTDVFSLGVVLYELLTLRRPFQGDSEHQIAEQIVLKDPPPLRAFRSRVPRDLEVIAGKALEKDRDRRFASMAELAADLRRFLASEPIRARPPSALDRAVKWTRRNRTKSTALAISAAAFLVISLLLVDARRSRGELARANQALSRKTAEAEDSAVRAAREAESARSKTEQLLRLSALQRLEDLEADSEPLWPPLPALLPGYERWLRDADALLAELPEHRRTLAELRSRALPWTQADAERRRAEDPLFPELEEARGRRAYLQRLTAVLDGGGVETEPGPSGELPATCEEAEALAWPRVDPDRSVFGEEPRGLRLARHALALADPGRRAELHDTLAWALLANGRLDEAVQEEERAVETAEGEARERLALRQSRLLEAVEREIEPDRAAERAAELRELEGRVTALEARTTPAREWHFEDEQDRWWHGQLEKLVNGLEALADPVHGLASGEFAGRHGWGVRRRADFARTIEARSVSGPEARSRWQEATASIADVRACPRYSGLHLTPQIGLLPIGRDPDSGLWEFAHLQSGEPAARDADGRLVLAEGTGIVLVLLPGGSFFMGAQANDPDAPNHDPDRTQDDLPVHEERLIGSYAPNPFGLHDTLGNVCEWCRDLLDDAGPERIARGGGYAYDALSARSAYRAFSSPEDVDSNLGVRPARRVTP